MVSRAIFIFLIFSSVFLSQAGRAEPLWSRFDDRLAVSGSKTLGLQMLSVDGNRDMFYDDNYGFSPHYRNETNLTVTGQLFSGLSVTATLSNNRWNPNDRTVALNYDRKGTKASLGDITVSLAGNELIPFSKRLRGVTLTHDFGLCSVTAIMSQTKAAARTVTLAGNNTPGPYYLGASQIIDGSERVKIDEREIPRTDSSGLSNYTFDSFSGILTFSDGTIVPETSTVAVSFETQGFNSTAGEIFGVRTDVPAGKRASFGLTYLTQQSDRDRSQYRQITEPFHGNNALSLPYELLYVPLEGSVIVKVDGILQMSPADYTVNHPLHYVLFSRPIPSTSTILVSYIPRPENAVSGDRSVMGFDAKFKVSDSLTLTGQLARSSSDYSGTGSGGTATALRAVGKYGKLDFTVGLRDIESSFAPIESAGFFRNERGGNIDLRYTFSDRLNWFTRLDRFRRPDYYGSLNAGTGRTLTSTQSATGFEYKHPKLPLMRVTRNHIESDDGAGWRDVLNTDALSANWTVGRLSGTGELSRSSRSGTYLSPLDGSMQRRDSSSDTSRLSLRYLPGEKFSLAADIAGSKISNSDGTESDAKNYQLTATVNPTRTVHLSAIYRVADSGGHYNTSYGGYTGAGYSGSGYAGGYPIGSYVPSYGLKSVSRILNLGWTPSTRLSIDTSYNFSYAEGENNTNTSISGTDVGLTFSPSKVVTFRGHLSQQDGAFIGSGGDMSSRIGFATLSLGPVRKFQLDLNYQKMLSGTRLAGLAVGDPLYQYQDSTVNLNSLSAVLRRDIGGERWLFAEFLSSTATGLISNRKSVFAVGIEYPLNQILGLKVDWRLIDYADARNSGNNYRASMLNAQIGARFR